MHPNPTCRVRDLDGTYRTEWQRTNAISAILEIEGLIVFDLRLMHGPVDVRREGLHDYKCLPVKYSHNVGKQQLSFKRKRSTHLTFQRVIRLKRLDNDSNSKIKPP